SGLLVMASYNWGERRVIPLIQSLPANPRERNYWKLLATYRDKIPQETYDYVFYIVAAAVIGENPRLFGFDFHNPLGDLEKKESPTASATPSVNTAGGPLRRHLRRAARGEHVAHYLWWPNRIRPSLALPIAANRPAYVPVARK